MLRKKFKYILSYGGRTHTCAEDPKSWEEQTLGVSRSDDFGLNLESSVPLLFTKGAADILRKLYYERGAFSEASLIIHKLQNNLKYKVFYTGKLDFTTFQDKLYGVEMQTAETGLASKFADGKDTEYEITVPAGGTYLNYTGVAMEKYNQIQCGFGKLAEDESIGEDAYTLKGSRAVRNYSDRLSFVNPSGDTYSTMTFRVLAGAAFIFNINLHLKVTISANANITSTTPASGVLRIVLRKPLPPVLGQTLYTNTTLLTVPVSQTWAQGDNNRWDVFDYVSTLAVEIEASSQDNLITVVYVADNKGYDSIKIEEASGCYIETIDMVNSSYQESKLRVFTHEWLIEQLIKRIDPAAVLISEVDREASSRIDILTATQCIKNMGSIVNDAVIKAKLSDVLESYNKLQCVGFDVDGNTLTIRRRKQMYPEQEYSQIQATNITVQHDLSHQYRSVKVGSEVDIDADFGKTYPFICEKNFLLNDTVASEEYDLVHPFIIDPYAIEEYIVKTLTESSSSDDTKYCVLHCNYSELEEVNAVATFGTLYLPNNTSQWKAVTGYAIGDAPIGEIPVPTSWSFLMSYLLEEGTVFKWDVMNSDPICFEFKAKIKSDNIGQVGSIGACRYTMKIAGPAVVPGVGDITGSTEVTPVVKTEDGFIIDFTTSMIAQYGTTVSFLLEFLWEGTASITIESLTLKAFNYGKGELSLYKNHTLTNFKGDASSVFNVAYSPKRILQKHAEYLGVSTIGARNKVFELETSSLSNADISSQLGYETSEVVEDDSLDLSATNPMFLPMLINCDTSEDVVDLDVFKTKKYRYLRVTDKKSGRSFSGWINNITFAVTKNKQKSLEMQARGV